MTQKKKQKRAKNDEFASKKDRQRQSSPFIKKKQTNKNVFCRCFCSADDGSRSDDENYNRFTFKRTRRRR